MTLEMLLRLMLFLYRRVGIHIYRFMKELQVIVVWTLSQGIYLIIGAKQNNGLFAKTKESYFFYLKCNGVLHLI